MSESLEEIKKTITEARVHGIYNWNTETISSLITTIESQKEEIERLKSAIEQATRELPYGNSAYKILLKSLYPESFKAQGGDK